MKLFVYGTLKKEGANHRFLNKSKYLGEHKISNFVLFDMGFGFPYLKTLTGDFDEDEFVYGEVYEIDKKTLSNIDRLEGHPNHYRRILINYGKEVAGMFTYVTTYNYIPEAASILRYGYWPIAKKIKVIIDGRKYYDTADKLVFHMRFFDGDRTPTNKSYMDLVQERSLLNLNTYYEELFIRDCIHNNIIKEVL